MIFFVCTTRHLYPYNDKQNPFNEFNNHDKIGDFYLGLFLLLLVLKGKISHPSIAVIYGFLMLSAWEEGIRFCQITWQIKLIL